MDDIVILGAARTAIGTFGGALASTPPTELGCIVAKAAMERSRIKPDQISLVTFGHVINTEPRDMYVSRIAAMDAGIPDSVPAMNVNRLCGSGAQAIVSAMQSLALGDGDFGLAGGVENMSRSPYILPAARWGQKMGDVAAMDMMLGALNCPFGTGHMGVTAENVAAEHDVSRTDQDGFALNSQTRAANAIEQGYFRDQIVAVPVKVRRDAGNSWILTPMNTQGQQMLKRWPVCGRCSRKTEPSRRGMPAASMTVLRPWCWRAAVPQRPQASRRAPAFWATPMPVCAPRSWALGRCRRFRRC